MQPNRTSVAGLAFIASFEGFVDHPYNDPANNATIGYGHLLHVGPVTAEDRDKWGTITKPQGLELLADDVVRFETCVRQNVHPPLTMQARFDAMVSFSFNLGCGPLIGPSHVHTALNNAKRLGMPDAILPYNHAGGKVLPGLTRRRLAEARLWSTGKYAA